MFVAALAEPVAAFKLDEEIGVPTGEDMTGLALDSIAVQSNPLIKSAADSGGGSPSPGNEGDPDPVTCRQS